MLENGSGTAGRQLVQIIEDKRLSISVVIGSLWLNTIAKVIYVMYMYHILYHSLQLCRKQEFAFNSLS